jgi:hypothetical protein
MFHIDLLLIHIDYLLFVIIVDHFYGEHGIKECNVEVKYYISFFSEDIAKLTRTSVLIEKKYLPHDI